MSFILFLCLKENTIFSLLGMPFVAFVSLSVPQQWFEFVLFGRAWHRWVRARVLHPDNTCSTALEENTQCTLCIIVGQEGKR